MSYCYSNDGQSMRAVDPDYQSQPGEVVFDHYATDSELDAAFPGRVGLRLINLRTSRLGDINAHAAKLLATLSANYLKGRCKAGVSRLRKPTRWLLIPMRPRRYCRLSPPRAA